MESGLSACGARSVPSFVPKAGEPEKPVEADKMLGFDDEGSVTRRASQWAGQAKPAPLQCLPLGVKQNVIGFFLPKDAALTLGLVSRDLHQAVLQVHRLLRELASSPYIPLYNQLAADKRRTDQHIADLTRSEIEQPHKSPGRLGRMRNAVALLMTAKERAAAAAAHTADYNFHTGEANRLRAELDETAESVAFHIATERLERPQPEQHVLQRDFSRMHDAIAAGDVELVRTFTAVYLGLPPHFMPTDRKVAWLTHAKGVCTLEYFGRYPCGDPLGPEEQRWYDSIKIHVGAIVRSEHLSWDEKKQLVVLLALPRVDPVSHVHTVVKLDIVRYAMDHENPAVAASVLLGIHECGAAPDLRQWLLEAAAGSWEHGLDECVTAVGDSLGAVRDRAPEWIDPTVASLASMKTTRGN